MKVYFRHIIILSFLMLGSVIAIQADTYPTVSPQASFIGAEGDTIANGEVALVLLKAYFMQIHPISTSMICTIHGLSILGMKP